jgi:uncharacterized protein YcbK (DUF882 family)
VLQRRTLIKLGLGAGATAAFGLTTAAGAQTLSSFGEPVMDMAPRKVALHNLHTGESLHAIYWEEGRYVPGALAAVNKVLRDFRTGDEHMMDPRLLDLLSAVHGKVEGREPFQVISGYRSPKTNAMLHGLSHEVATGSLHMKGMAIDVRVEGVELRHLQAAALDLGRGGVGYYPTSDFVHMDVGAVRRWNGS